MKSVNNEHMLYFFSAKRTPRQGRQFENILAVKTVKRQSHTLLHGAD